MIKGIKSGAVLQRDEKDLCKIYLYSDSELKTSYGKLTFIGNDKWCLTDIPVGGPYSFTVSNKTESVELKDIYVGDLWLLGGQSNMEGAGYITDNDMEFVNNPNGKIRAFYMEYEWGTAVPLLHRLWKSKDLFIANLWKKDRANSKWKDYDLPDGEYAYEKNRGVGPGFSFALKMYQITKGVPQGVIPCAIGGSSLSGWNPDIKEGENYYTSMLNKFVECGSNVRGLFWDQGESEACDTKEVRENYIQNMVHLIGRLREDTVKDLKCVFVQITSTNLPQCIRLEESSVNWSYIKEQQRLLNKYIEGTDTVSSCNADFSDLIHKDSDSQNIIGCSGAISMAKLCGLGGEKAIALKGFKIKQNDTVPFRYDLEVYFDNVIDKLQSNGKPSGFSIQLSDDNPPVFWPSIYIQNIKLKNNVAIINNELEYEQLLNASVYYGLGHNSVNTIEDGKHRYLLAFGPLKVKDYLLKD